MDYSSSSGLASSASRILAIIGFIALIAIGMYGSVRVAQSVPGLFSQMGAAIVSITSIFVPAEETIIVSLPSYTVLHDAPVTVAYEHRNKDGEGAYAFRYSCVDSVSIETVEGGAAVSIACNTPYTFQPFNNSVTVTPRSEGARYADIEIFISFSPEGGGAPIIGSTLMTVENLKADTKKPAVPAPPAPQTPSTPSAPPKRETIVIPQGRASDPNGYTDLTARVIEVGYMDPSGAFVASSTPSRQYRIAVRFAIENVGSKTSNEFTFSAVLPTFPPYTYFSPAQVALGPGDRIEFTIGFDSFEQDNTGDFVVNVDPSARVNERDKANNIIRYTVTVVK